jgi:hypothetical protein
MEESGYEFPKTVSASGRFRAEAAIATDQTAKSAGSNTA